jgi:Zn-dependent protease with chaperone function
VRIDVYVPFLITAVLAILTPRLAPRLTPRPAAWALACTALLTAAGWLGALSLLAFTALAQIPAVAQEGRWSVQLMRAEDPVHFAVAVGCGLALAMSGVSLGIAVVRQARDLRWARREGRHLPGDTELAVLDDESPEAFALPGKPGRIVVSRGMLRCLSDNERAALLVHERSHLRNRHHLFQAVWRLTAAVNPLLRPLAHAGGFVLERWADEDAADHLGDRTVVAHAVARAALATSADRSRSRALSATGGAVPQRVRALLAPAPRHRLLPFVAASLLLALCWVSLGKAASDSEQMVDIAQQPACTMVGAPHQATPAARTATHHDRRHPAARARTSERRCDIPHYALSRSSI